MRINFVIPFENEHRRLRRDPGYALFRNEYWAALLIIAAQKRRTPRKASMVLPGQPGRAMEEFLVSGPLYGDSVLLH